MIEGDTRSLDCSSYGGTFEKVHVVASRGL